MGALGPNSGATFADDATVGSVAISNPSNAGSADATYATAILIATNISHYLKATNFGFQIPTDATILGILVEVNRSATVSVALTDSSVKLVKGGSIGGTDKVSGSNWPTSDAYASYGSAADLWGQAWTPADINASTFGVAIAATATIGATVQIDHVRITVTYQGSNRPVMGKQVKWGAGMGGADFVS